MEWETWKSTYFSTAEEKSNNRLVKASCKFSVATLSHCLSWIVLGSFRPLDLSDLLCRSSNLFATGERAYSQKFNVQRILDCHLKKSTLWGRRDSAHSWGAHKRWTKSEPFWPSRGYCQEMETNFAEVSASLSGMFTWWEASEASLPIGRYLGNQKEPLAISTTVSWIFFESSGQEN